MWASGTVYCEALPDRGKGCFLSPKELVGRVKPTGTNEARSEH